MYFNKFGYAWTLIKNEKTGVTVVAQLIEAGTITPVEPASSGTFLVQRPPFTDRGTLCSNWEIAVDEAIRSRIQALRSKANRLAGDNWKSEMPPSPKHLI